MTHHLVVVVQRHRLALDLLARRPAAQLLVDVGIVLDEQLTGLLAERRALHRSDVDVGHAQRDRQRAAVHVQGGLEDRAVPGVPPRRGGQDGVADHVDLLFLVAPGLLHRHHHLLRRAVLVLALAAAPEPRQLLGQHLQASRQRDLLHFHLAVLDGVVVPARPDAQLDHALRAVVRVAEAHGAEQVDRAADDPGGVVDVVELAPGGAVGAEAVAEQGLDGGHVMLLHRTGSMWDSFALVRSTDLGRISALQANPAQSRHTTALCGTRLSPSRISFTHCNADK